MTIATLALTACVMTPEDVMNQGVMLTATSRQAPREVAACIEKNAVNVTQRATTIAYPLSRSEFEVVLNYPDAGAAAVFSVEASAGGSTITAWIAQVLFPTEVAFSNLIWGC